MFSPLYNYSWPMTVPPQQGSSRLWRANDPGPAGIISLDRLVAARECKAATVAMEVQMRTGGSLVRLA